MIPTMILFGLAFGRWWWGALIASAFVMPALGFLGDAIGSTGEVLAAAILGVANAAVGVGVHQGVLQAIRRWG